MKAKLAAVAIATLLCTGLWAQNSEKRWKWTTEAETQVGSMRNFGVGATFGRQFTERLYAGLGTDLLFSAKGNGGDNLYFPLFAVGKIDILKQENTPVIDMRGGLELLDRNGYGSLAFGYKMKGEKAVVCPEIGWVIESEYTNSVVLRFAIEF